MRIVGGGSDGNVIPYQDHFINSPFMKDLYNNLKMIINMKLRSKSTICGVQWRPYASAPF